MRIRLGLIFLILCHLLPAQKPVVLSDFVQEVGISDMQLQYLEDSDCSVLPAELFSGMMDHQFRAVDFSNPDPALIKNETESCFWFRFYFVNRSTNQFSFHLQHNDISEFNEYVLHQRIDNGNVTTRKSGNKLHHNSASRPGSYKH